MLDIIRYQTNTEISQSIEIDDLYGNPTNFSDLLNDNQIKILNTLEKSSFFALY